MAHDKHQGIYVDLDALVDTRLATFQLMHPSLVIEALDAGYISREVDSFPKVKKEVCKELSATRDKEVLEVGAYTGILGFIKSMVKGLLSESIDSPITETVSLTLNTYPYILTPEEQEDFVKVLRHCTTDLIPIDIIHLDEKSLTPSYCNKRFSTMIKYEYGSWIDYHAMTKDILKSPMTAITLFAPEIYFVRVPTSEEKRKFKRENTPPFKMLELHLSPFISLKLIDILFFCVDMSVPARSKAA